jgi:hypothetical protein
VAPIVGVFRTSGGQEGDQKVDVVPVEAAPPAEFMENKGCCAPSF